MLLTALTRAGNPRLEQWSKDEISKLAVGKMGMTTGMWFLAFLTRWCRQTSLQSYFFSQFYSLCWGVGVCKHLQVLRHQITYSWYTYFFLILQVETREIPIKYKAEYLQNVGSSNGTNCPENLCNCHPWRNSELVRTRSWAAGSNFEVGPPLSRGLDQTTSTGLFQPTVLWHFAQWLIKIFWRLSKWVQDKEGKCRFFGLFYLYFYKKPSVLLPVREDSSE